MRCHDEFFPEKHILISGPQMLPRPLFGWCIGSLYWESAKCWPKRTKEIHTFGFHTLYCLSWEFTSAPNSYFLSLRRSNPIQRRRTHSVVSDESSYPAGGSSSFSSARPISVPPNWVPTDHWCPNLPASHRSVQHPACSVCQNTASNGVDRTVSMLVIAAAFLAQPLRISLFR
jgi:hypothetical protein